MNEKVKEYKETKYNSQQDYESVLIKYENDIRGHIKIEHQLKLYIENLQDEIDTIENEKRFLNQIIIDLNNNINNQIYKPNKYYELENEIELLKKDISDKIILIKSYEEQNLKLASNEKRLKTLIIIKEKSYLENEEKYKKLIQEMNKKLIYYQDLLKNKYNTSNHNFNDNNNSNNCSPSSTLREEKSNLNLIKTPNDKHKKNNISFLSISKSIDKIEKILRNKILSSHKKIRSLSNSNKKDTYNNNSSIIVSKKQKEFLSKLFINNTTYFSNKKNKTLHNRYKSFENLSRPTKIKSSSIFKDFIINSNNVKIQKEKVKNYKYHIRSSSQGKINKKIQFINNINIFTNPVKHDKYNTFKDNTSNRNNNKNTINKNILNNSERNNKPKIKTSNSISKLY